MTRFALILATAAFSSPALAQDSPEQSCFHQAQVVAAIQNARNDRVSERDVQSHILASSPPWPEQYNNAIPLITPWVYEQKRRIVRNEDLSAAWSEICLQQQGN